MQRRSALLISSLLLCAPAAALAQSAQKKIRIGILFGDAPLAHEEAALLEGLHEQGLVGEIPKTRPCVVVSPGEMNARMPTVTVAPMTTGSKPARFRVALTLQGKQGSIVLDQVRTLDRVRLVKRLGALRPTTLAATLQTLQAMFAP